jgi:hypothetical protein
MMWSKEQANDWYAGQPWLVGCNFLPSTAINQLEMWQAETFDPDTIDRELGWAASIGFNTVRVYLHDLAWQADAAGFKQRIDRFLGIAASRGIHPMLVIFDDCWNPDPRIGPQPAPEPGVHNSGWVQSPGRAVVRLGRSAWARLEQYVRDSISTFARDERILLWDLYNEPGNVGSGERSLPLLQAAFEWARSASPAQPLTAGLWFNNKALNDFQLAASDVITFHNYGSAPQLERQIAGLRAHGRPLICTEWMARTRGSLVGANLPVFAREKVGCLNWGLVAGKSNTIYGWASRARFLDPRIWFRQAPATVSEPKVWFHDLLRADGTPFDAAEIELFRKLTAR